MEHLSALWFVLFAEMVGAVIAVFIMAVLYEGLKTLRDYLLMKGIGQYRAQKFTVVSGDSAERTPLNPTGTLRQVMF